MGGLFSLCNATLMAHFTHKFTMPVMGGISPLKLFFERSLQPSVPRREVSVSTKPFQHDPRTDSSDYRGKPRPETAKLSKGWCR